MSDQPNQPEYLDGCQDPVVYRWSGREYELGCAQPTKVSAKNSAWPVQASLLTLEQCNSSLVGCHDTSR